MQVIDSAQLARTCGGFVNNINHSAGIQGVITGALFGAFAAGAMQLHELRTRYLEASQKE